MHFRHNGAYCDVDRQQIAIDTHTHTHTHRVAVAEWQKADAGSTARALVCGHAEGIAIASWCSSSSWRGTIFILNFDASFLH